MSKEDMIREINEMLDEADDRDVEDIYWTIKDNLGWKRLGGSRGGGSRLLYYNRIALDNAELC